MSNIAPTPPSVFTKMLAGRIADAPFVFRDDEFGVAVILSDRYVNPGHGVVFPTRQAETVDDMTVAERLRVDAVTHALRTLLKQTYDPLTVVEHTEGFGLPVPHAHRVVFPVFGRGESDRIHHKEQLTPADADYYRRVLGELTLTDDMIEAAMPQKFIYEPVGSLQTLAGRSPF